MIQKIAIFGLILILSSCAYAGRSSFSKQHINNVIVKFHRGVSKIKIYKIAKKIGIDYVHFLSKHPENGYIVLMGSTLPFDRIKKTLKMQKEVKTVEPNYKRKSLNGE